LSFEFVLKTIAFTTSPSDPKEAFQWNHFYHQPLVTSLRHDIIRLGVVIIVSSSLLLPPAARSSEKAQTLTQFQGLVGTLRDLSPL